MKTYSRIHQSVEDMLAAADAGYRAGRKWESIDNLAGSSEWIGRRFEGWTEVKRKAGEYWQEGLDEFQEMLHLLRDLALPPIACQKRRPRWESDSGDEVDNDRLRSGQEYWRTMRRESAAGPQTFCIITNISTPGGMDSLSILWRGAVALVLADLLERQGHRVELWAADRGLGAYQNGAGSFQAVCLKAADQPLDISTLVTAVSGWFYRTVFFQDLCSEPAARASYGLGKATQISEQDEAVKELVGNATMVVVDRVWSRNDAAELVRRTIENLSK